MKVLHERVAGIDVHKDMIKVAIRSPGDKPWTRTTEILEYRTFYGVLQEMARELRRRGVTHVVMEASGACTEPVYYALCEQDFTEVAVINPAHAKALKGHKTDAKDCARLAELFECGLLHGSYIPAPELKEVRDLTRYWMKTVQARTSEIQRLAKALESAGIKLGSVASSITGVPATAMIEALTGGERRGQVLAGLARGRMREAGKLADLPVALTGRFTEHHALLCHLHQDRIAGFDAAVAGLDERIAGKVTRWQREAALLTSVPGFGDVVARAWLGEIGPAPHRHFATHEKLASWVTLCPGNNISARKRKHGQTGDAGTYIKPMLVQAAWNAIRAPGAAAGPVPPAGPPFRRGQEPGREEEGDHRDRAHPAQDRLPGAQERDALHRPGRGLLHPPRIAGAKAGLAGAPAAQAAPRLHHHHHHQPAAGRLSTRRLTTSPFPQPRSRRPRTLPTPRRDNQRHLLALPPPRPRFAAARHPGPSFRVRLSGRTPAGGDTQSIILSPGQRPAPRGPR
jgi:transposase